MTRRRRTRQRSIQNPLQHTEPKYRAFGGRAVQDVIQTLGPAVGLMAQGQFVSLRMRIEGDLVSLCAKIKEISEQRREQAVLYPFPGVPEPVNVEIPAEEQISLWRAHLVDEMTKLLELSSSHLYGCSVVAGLQVGIDNVDLRRADLQAYVECPLSDYPVQAGC